MERDLHRSFGPGCRFDGCSLKILDGNSLLRQRIDFCHLRVGYLGRQGQIFSVLLDQLVTLLAEDETEELGHPSVQWLA